MARFKKIPQNRHEGKIVYGKNIVDGIVILSVKEVDFVELDATSPRSKMRSSAIKVTYAKDGVHVDVAVRIHYSQCVTDMAFKIQEAIRHNIEAMSEYHIVSVNVIVKGVMFDDLKKKAKKTEDKSEETNEN